jgi:microcystin-dependent protein
MAQVGAQFVQAVQPVPVGSLQPYAGANAPTGWLLCDGGSYSTTLYPDLYSVLGYTYGGSGASFNVPDLRGRVPMGAGTGAQNGGSGTGVISGGTALTARARGAFGGDERLQSHGHTSPGQTLGTIYYAGGSPLQGWNPDGVDGTSRATTNTGSGSGGNMPPFVVTNYIIKALPDVPRQGMALGTTPPIVTALPVNPQFGEVVTYAADATNGVYWNLQYDASGTYPWKYIGGSPYVVSTFTGEGTTSTSYVDLTSGPQIAIPLAGDFMVDIECSMASTSSAAGAMSYAVGATGALDNDAIWSQVSGPGYQNNGSSLRRKTISTAGTILTAKYKSPTGASITFYNRIFNVTPVRVKAG